MHQCESESVRIARHQKHQLLPMFIGGVLLVVVLVVLYNNTLSAASKTKEASNATTPLAEVLGQIGEARVVLVGETHTRYDHHLIQLDVLKQLYQQSPKLALGVEWFQQPYQKHLNDYIAGHISEAEMLDRTEYFERWMYDYRLYQPIIQYAREQQIPIVALNASRELTSALRENGFDDLPAELQAQLPDNYDWSDKDYEQRLREFFKTHPEFGGEFEDFMRIQLTWDESMAERAAEYLQAHPESRMLVLAGSGHISYGSGIPNRIKRRLDNNSQISIIITDDNEPKSKEMAGFLVSSKAQELEPTGLLGAYLVTEDHRVVIAGFSDNSAVKDAGIKKGDVIVGINDKRITTYAELKLALFGNRPGDTVELHSLDKDQSDQQARTSRIIELR